MKFSFNRQNYQGLGDVVEAFAKVTGVKAASVRQDEGIVLSRLIIRVP